MKQKLLLLETKEEDGRNKREFDLERKLQSLRELEVEVVELRRTNKELQHQKRELTIKINAVETEVQHLMNRTEVCVCVFLSGLWRMLPLQHSILSVKSMGFPFGVVFGHLLQVASLEIFYENALISS